MAKRNDAARALDKLKGTQFLGYTLKAAWAPSRIMKDQYKDYWDVDAGAIYVPWPELPPNVETLAAEGALIDEETLPEHLKSKPHFILLDSLAVVVSQFKLSTYLYVHNLYGLLPSLPGVNCPKAN